MKSPQEEFEEILKKFIINDYTRDNFNIEKSIYAFVPKEVISAMQSAYNLALTHASEAATSWGFTNGDYSTEHGVDKQSILNLMIKE